MRDHDKRNTRLTSNYFRGMSDGVSSGATDDDPPEEVLDFLVERVRDLECLELLMLCCGAPETAWSREMVIERLRLPLASVEGAFASLIDVGLVRVEPGGDAIRYAPATPELRDGCARVRALYDADRIRMIMLMSRLAMQRLRTSAARAFADAFRFRKPGGR